MARRSVGHLAIASALACLSLLAPPARAQTLPRDAVRSFGQAAMRHPAIITHATLSGDGSRAATLAIDGKLRLWDVASGKLLAMRDQRRENVASIQLAPDGKSVLVVDHSQGLLLCGGVNLQDTRNLGRSFLATISPGGERLVVMRISNRPFAEIVETATGKAVRKLADVVMVPAGMAFQSDDTVVLFHQQGGVAWYKADGEKLGESRIALAQPVQPGKLSALGNRIAAVDQNKLMVFDVPQRPGDKPIEGTRIVDVKPGSHVIQISPDGRFVLMMIPTGGMQVWDVSKKRDVTGEVRISTTMQYGVAMTVFSGDSKRIAAGLYGECLQVLDTATWKPASSAEGHAGAVRKLQCTSDGRLLVTSSADGTVRIWERHTGKQVRAIDDAVVSPSAFGLTPDGRRLATVRIDKRLVIDSPDGKGESQEQALAGAPAGTSCEISPDGRYAAVLSQADLRLFDLKDKREAGRFQLKGRSGPGRLWVSPAARSIACWQGNQFSIYGIDTGAPAAAAPVSIEALASTAAQGNPDFTSASPSRGWDTILVCRSPLDVRLVEAFSSQDLLSLKSALTPAAKQPPQQALIFIQQQQARAQSSAVALSDTGRILATATGTDRRIRIWDARGGECLHSTEPAPSTVTALEFSDDGRAVFAGCGDGSVVEWQIPAAALARLVNREAPTTAELQVCVEKLAANQPAEAHAAIIRLSDAGPAAIPVLAQAVLPPRLDAAEYQRLLALLDGDDFAGREKAEKSLVALGPIAVPALKQTLAAAISGELLNRIPAILMKIQRSERTSPVLLQRIRAAQVLETIGTPAALEALKAAESPQQPPTVTTRIRLGIDRLGAGVQASSN